MIEAPNSPTSPLRHMTKRFLDFASLALATGLGVAYLTPFAKATLASAVTVAVYAALTWGDDGFNPILIVVIAVVFFVGVVVSARVKSEEDPDPSKVVIDEVAGQLTAFLILAPVEWWSLLAAFLLFRLFDIVKPFGIRRLEAIPNGWGIMLDDLAAGLLAAVHYQRRGIDRQGGWLRRSTNCLQGRKRGQILANRDRPFPLDSRLRGNDGSGRATT